MAHCTYCIFDGKLVILFETVCSFFFNVVRQDILIFAKDLHMSHVIGLGTDDVMLIIYVTVLINKTAAKCFQWMQIKSGDIAYC